MPVVGRGGVSDHPWRRVQCFGHRSTSNRDRQGGIARTGERRVFVADGKGGHQRLVLLSGRPFASVAAYLDAERPADADTDRVVVAL
jgi:hypothetical protein